MSPQENIVGMMIWMWVAPTLSMLANAYLNMHNTTWNMYCIFLCKKDKRSIICRVFTICTLSNQRMFQSFGSPKIWPQNIQYEYNHTMHELNIQTTCYGMRFQPLYSSPYYNNTYVYLVNAAAPLTPNKISVVLWSWRPIVSGRSGVFKHIAEIKLVYI